jgi:predicted DCC family thiol-disulfide oxidoreductase YuxK
VAPRATKRSLRTGSPASAGLFLVSFRKRARHGKHVVIVVFDAQCLLCNGWVQFLLRHDRRGALQFASIQGSAGRQLLARNGLAIDGLETLLLIDGPRTWQHTAAIFRVLHALGWPWRLAWLAWGVPSFIRDPLYRLVARHRYRVFGRSDTCILPPADHAARFLD